MESFERELLVARIISGTIRLEVNGDYYTLKQPSRERRYLAQELFCQVFKESELSGLYNEDELEDFLFSEGLWDDDKDELLKKIPKDIEDMKVRLFQLAFKSNERQGVRKMLANAKTKLGDLATQRNAYAYLSCLGAAHLARAKYMLGSSLYHENGLPVFTADNFWEASSDLLDVASTIYGETKLSEDILRELARTEPWRTTWSCKRAESSLFGIATVDYSDEQKSLVGWSQLYDNIYEHPECPGEEILTDDDMLDGWLINQRRERDAKKIAAGANQAIGNEKIRNSQEVFIMADTQKDAEKIHNLNSGGAKFTHKQRMQHLKDNAGKIVNELDMPDTKMRVIMEQMSQPRK